MYATIPYLTSFMQQRMLRADSITHLEVSMSTQSSHYDPPVIPKHINTSIITAFDRNGLIGNTAHQDNFGMPWEKISADMRHFRELTMGKPLIMGRKTYDYFGGKPLPGRATIVLSHQWDIERDGVAMAESVEGALAPAKVLALQNGVSEVMIGGGATVYREFLPHTDRLYLTFIDSEFEGDVRFPAVDFRYWMQVGETVEHPKGDDSPYNIMFKTFERKRLLKEPAAV